MRCNQEKFATKSLDDSLTTIFDRLLRLSLVNAKGFAGHAEWVDKTIQKWHQPMEKHELVHMEAKKTHGVSKKYKP